jgi:hypothetical protein
MSRPTALPGANERLTPCLWRLGGLTPAGSAPRDPPINEPCYEPRRGVGGERIGIDDRCSAAFAHGLRQEAGPEIVESTFDLFWQGSLLASGASILPAIGVIVIGEVARIRSWLYYVIGGGLALAAIPLLARINSSGVGTLSEATVWQVFATAGFAGGLVYWIVAGRNA